MIEFINNYFNTPTYMLTGMDKLKMGLICAGIFIVAMLCIYVSYVICIVISTKKKHRKITCKKKNDVIE